MISRGTEYGGSCVLDLSTLLVFISLCFVVLYKRRTPALGIALYTLRLPRDGLSPFLYSVSLSCALFLPFYGCYCALFTFSFLLARCRFPTDVLSCVVRLALPYLQSLFIPLGKLCHVGLFYDEFSVLDFQMMVLGMRTLMAWGLSATKE